MMESRAPGLAFSLAVLHALAGENEQARRQLQQLMAQEGMGLSKSERPRFGGYLLANIARGLEAAILIEDRPLVTTLVSELEQGPAFSDTGGGSTCLHRHLGAAAALLGDTDKAMDWYRRAIEACQQVRSRPELALSRLGLAELLLDHYPDERAGAIEHLDLAVGELREMKMQPALERALRRKLQLQGADSVSASTSIDAITANMAAEPPDLRSHTAPDGTVTLLFTDIEDSTGLTVRLGDQRWLELLRGHHALVRREVHRHGGFEVKNQGDGFMLAFQSARRALECAIAIQRAVAAAPTDPPIRVRMGLHTGEVLKNQDDFHGKHVVLAARIANQASGGEILISSLLKELTESSGDLHFDSGREVALKGLDGAHHVYSVRFG
jgi:class 3 adenylate cyclase